MPLLAYAARNSPEPTPASLQTPPSGQGTAAPPSAPRRCNLVPQRHSAPGSRAITVSFLVAAPSRSGRPVFFPPLFAIRRTANNSPKAPSFCSRLSLEFAFCSLRLAPRGAARKRCFIRGVHRAPQSEVLRLIGEESEASGSGALPSSESRRSFRLPEPSVLKNLSACDCSPPGHRYQYSCFCRSQARI